MMTTSNLGHLGMIAHQNGTMPRWPVPGTVRPGARALSCGSLGSHRRRGRRIPKGTWGPAGEAAFGHSSLNLAPRLAARAQPAGTSRRRALPRAVAVTQRARGRDCADACVRVCLRACMHACVR